MNKLNASMSSNEMIGILAENDYNISDILIRVRNNVGDSDEYKELLITLDSVFYNPDQIIRLWSVISKSELKTFIANVRKLRNPEEAKKIIEEIRNTTNFYSYFN